MSCPDQVAHELSGFVSCKETAQRSERAASSAVSGRTEVPSDESTYVPGQVASKTYEDKVSLISDSIRSARRVTSLNRPFQPDAV
jgi:hypothetical protein